MKLVLCATAAFWLWNSAILAADRSVIADQQFRDQIQNLKRSRAGGERTRRAHQILSGHMLSSQQVKAIASDLPDDHARFEFALAAYPYTVDPENFYDVYDAFKTFSKVMRLHDEVRRIQRPPGPHPARVPLAVTDQEMRDILKAVRRESFDSAKSQVARQILSTSRGSFLSSQIKELVSCFDFDASRLEIAKFAYDYTLDKERYFLVNEAFDFSSNRDNLSRYVESRNKETDKRHQH